MRPDEQRAWQREQQRQADNARAAAKARQQQQQRDTEASNQAAAQARKRAYEDAMRANRERQEAKQLEKDRKAHDYHMKLRQQGQQTYPYSPPVSTNPVVHPLDGGGTLSGGGSSKKGKGALGKGVLVVIGLFVAFAYFGSRSDRSSNPEPAPAPEATESAPMPTPEPPRTVEPTPPVEPPQAAQVPKPTPVSPFQQDYRGEPVPSHLPQTPVLPQAPPPLQAVYTVKPGYPLLARQARMQGTISVVLEVGTDGSVVSARAQRGNPILAQAAEQAARQWRYSPYAAVSGQPLRTTVVNFNFDLDN
jgi:protein TonB